MTKLSTTDHPTLNRVFLFKCDTLQRSIGSIDAGSALSSEDCPILHFKQRRDPEIEIARRKAHKMANNGGYTA